MEPEEPEVRMTLVEHLEELRRRLLRSLLALGIALVAAVIFYKPLVGMMTLPHFQAMSWLAPPPPNAILIAGGYGDPVLAIMKLCFIAAVFLASPLIGRELWGFVAAGLTRQERRAAATFAPVSFLLFLLGCVFGYFVLVPYALYGMARMLPVDQILPVFKFSDYLGLVLTMTILLGAVFQLPLVMVLLSRLGLVEPGAYRRYRKHAVIGNLVLAALLSPAEIVSLFIFAVPLCLLYEAGIVCASWGAPRPSAVPRPA